MFRNEIMVMSTAEYAKYITDLTGKKKSPQSVANDCRNKKLDCYRTDEKGEWRIRVKRRFVPAEDYDKLKAEYDEAIGVLRNIRKLAEVRKLAEC